MVCYAVNEYKKMQGNFLIIQCFYITFSLNSVLPQTKMLSAVKESALSVIRLILTTSHPDVQLAAAGLPPFPDDE